MLIMVVKVTCAANELAVSALPRSPASSEPPGYVVYLFSLAIQVPLQRAFISPSNSANTDSIFSIL